MTTNDAPPITLHLANVILHRIDLAQRQYRRTNEALSSAWALRASMGFAEGVVPEPIIEADQETEDAGHFLIVALRSAARGHQVLKRAGVDVPEIREWEKLAALRNLHEHWDGWETEPYGLSDEPWRRSKAGETWARLAEGKPTRGSMSFGDPDPDGVRRLHSFRGLELASLLDDLETLREVVVALEQQAFEYEVPSLEQAAELIGGQRLTAAQWFVTGFRPIRARDGLLRYRREEVLEAARMVDANWATPFSEPQPELPEA
jgi:hypothetical protein